VVATVSSHAKKACRLLKLTGQSVEQLDPTSVYNTSLNFVPPAQRWHTVGGMTAAHVRQLRWSNGLQLQVGKGLFAVSTQMEFKKK